MKLINANGILDFKALGYIAKTLSFELTPSQKIVKYSIIGKDGDITFTNGLVNKNIKVMLVSVANSRLAERRILDYNITEQLLIGGWLVLDYEPALMREVRVLNASNIKFNTAYDTFEIDFDSKPYAVDLVDIIIPTWSDNDLSYTVSNEVFVVSNGGNYNSKPVIKIIGSGNVSLTANGKTFTLTGLVDFAYIDCDKMVVYKDLATSKMNLFTGEFLELTPGLNSITITGSATVEFNHVSRWV